MNKMMVAVVGLLAGVMTGCKSYDMTVVKTGLFQNNLQAMFKSYDEIRPGVTTRGELQDKLGFNLRAPNVREIQAKDAMKLMLGENYFQVAYNIQSKIEDFVMYLNEYSMYVVPYKELLKVEDRFYVSTRKETLTGPDAEFYFVFKGDVLIYRAKNFRQVQEDRKHTAFLQGLFPWLKIVKDVKGIVE